MNRVDFIIRTIQYYTSIESHHSIYIGDASDTSSKKRVMKVANGKLDIHYFHWKGLSDRKTCGSLAKHALKNHKFCAFQGDDDYLVPESLSLCADFLKKHDDYATAQGNAVVFSLDKSGPYGNISSFSTYWNHKQLTEDTAQKRLTEITNNYWVPIFSIHRTSEFIEDMLSGVDEILDRNFGELNNSFSMAIRGKSKFIDCLYLVRNGHDRIDHPTHYGWISDTLWRPSLLNVIEQLTLTLGKVDGISDKDSRMIVESCIEGYINSGDSYCDYRALIKRYLTSLNLFVFLQKIRSVFFTFYSVFSPDSLRIESLKLKRSKYYKDFSPILRSLKKPS